MFNSPQIDKVFTFVPPVDTSAYATGDAMGVAALHLSHAVTSDGGAGGIAKIVLIDKDKQSKAIDLVFFSANPAAATDNAAFNPSAADADKIIGVISLVAGDYAALSSQTVATKIFNPPWEFKAVNSSDVWVQLVARSTNTYSVATNLTLKIEVRQK